MESIKEQRHGHLIQLCCIGNRDAQQKIYNLYAKNMFNTALRIAGNYEDASDVVQEAFIEVFTKIHLYKEKSTFGYWLKQIVVNKAITQLKKNKKSVFTSLEESEALLVHEADDQEANEIPILLEVERIKSAINQLPQGYKLVITLYLLEGYDHDEISEILGVSKSTTRTQYTRGKKRLMEILLNK